MTTKRGRRVRERSWRMRVGRMKKTRRRAVGKKRMVLDSLLSTATLMIWKREMETTMRLQSKRRMTTLKTRRTRKREGGRKGN